RRVDERPDLLLHRANHTGMRVPDARHRDARAKIKVALSILIPHLAPAPAREPQIEARIRRDDVAIVEFARGERAVLHLEKAANIAPPRGNSRKNEHPSGIRTRRIPAR